MTETQQKKLAAEYIGTLTHRIDGLKDVLRDMKRSKRDGRYKEVFEKYRDINSDAEYLEHLAGNMYSSLSGE